MCASPRRPRPKPRARALAIVGASRVSPALVRDLEQFAHDYAPDDAVGVVDLEGFRWFRGPGLAAMSAEGRQAERWLRARAPEAAALHLFSDLNQWMLKVLLAPGIAPDLLGAPRGEYRNASQLSAAASVSVMSAFRFVRQLRREGFLDEASPILRLVRLEELLRRWQVAHLGPAREVSMQWILRGDPERQLHDALRDAVVAPPAASSGSRQPGVPLRACLGLFAAADALGLGFVRGVVPHVFFERLDAAALERLGLSLEAPRSEPDVFVRLARAAESVFRGVVWRDGVPVSDVLQVWLDASAHPSRGAEQADLIYRRVLKPLVDRRRS